MSPRKHCRYPEAFKQEALALWEGSGKSMSQIERELDIGSGQLWRWRRQYHPVGTGKAGEGLELRDLEAARAEIRRLQRELTSVEEERDILKKAIHIGEIQCIMKLN